MTGETESHSSTLLYHTLYIFVLARSLHNFSIKKNPTTQLPKSSYLREVAKIASQCVRRAEMDACNRCILCSHCSLKVQPGQHISSVRPTVWQCFHAAHLPHHTNGAGCKKAWKQQQNGQHTHAFS